MFYVESENAPFVTPQNTFPAQIVVESQKMKIVFNIVHPHRQIAREVLTSFMIRHTPKTLSTTTYFSLAHFCEVWNFLKSQFRLIFHSWNSDRIIYLRVTSSFEQRTRSLLEKLLLVFFLEPQWSFRVVNWVLTKIFVCIFFVRADPSCVLPGCFNH